jgi:NADPH:quinone reductase
MRAVRFHRFNGPLVVDDVPEPEAVAGEVLFQAHVVGVNPLDVWVTLGTVAGGKQPLPFVPGSEATGEVDGRTVLVRGGGLGVSRDGLYRERAAVPSDAMLPLPPEVDPAEAVAVGVAGSTAWMLVMEVAKVTADDRVLILGASGGVGSLAVQLATGRGAVVWGQTSREEKADFLMELGVERALVATAADLSDAAAELAPTVVIDPLAGSYTGAAIAAMEPFGRLVLYGASDGPVGELDLRTLYRKSIQLLTYSGTIESQERNRRAMEQALKELAEKRLRPRIDEVLPMERAQVAHDRIREHRVRGKLLLVP